MNCFKWCLKTLIINIVHESNECETHQQHLSMTKSWKSGILWVNTLRPATQPQWYNNNEQNKDMWIFYEMYSKFLLCICILATTKQLYEWFGLSVFPLVHPSVRHTFFIMFPSSHHHAIFRSYYHWQRWCRWKGSMSEVKGQSHRCKKMCLFLDHYSRIKLPMVTKWCTKLKVV